MAFAITKIFFFSETRDEFLCKLVSDESRSCFRNYQKRWSVVRDCFRRTIWEKKIPWKFHVAAFRVLPRSFRHSFPSSVVSSRFQFKALIDGNFPMLDEKNCSDVWTWWTWSFSFWVVTPSNDALVTNSSDSQNPFIPLTLRGVDWIETIDTAAKGKCTVNVNDSNLLLCKFWWIFNSMQRKLARKRDWNSKTSD